MPMISDPFGGRDIEEWVGSSPNAKVPDRIRDRVFFRANGICHISGRKIIVPRDRWQLEHVKPLSMGGEHRESNMRPALIDAHKGKTSDEAAARAKADRIRRKANGTWPEPIGNAKLQSRGFASTRRFQK
ncbi:HNH endonuclease [bacterium M00.F.Ca.ET.159.01.1.1]|nr:HNH endonuclease [bacterium M00.F.Ca.ET.159.01.1.1]TGT79181.1 HNH endonuclease [bacterium M00.F.Ca.ET.157.01.1.1]